MYTENAQEIGGFLTNSAIWAAIWSWGAAQVIKIFTGVIREHRFNFKWLLTTGGMPSAHSAGVSAVATAVGMHAGFGSLLFAVSFVFAVIIMFDAQGIRRMAGRQAVVLNRIVEDIYEHRGVNEQRLKELLGHTPIEVFMGALLGIAMALVIAIP